MIARILTLVLIGSLATGALAQTRTKPPKGRSGAKSADKPRKPKTKKRAPRNLAAKALRLVIDDAEFDDMTFEDFVDWLGRQTKANVVVHWKIIEKAGVERDAPIFLEQKKITVRKLLPLVFRQVTEGMDVELAARADGNILLISTRKHLNSKMIVRTYSVQDLLLHVPNFEAARVDIDGTGRRGIVGGRGPVRGGQAGRRDPHAGLDARIRRLIAVITQSVEPDSWRINGGKGTLSYFRGQLVIRNGLEVHQKIAGALSDKPGRASRR